MKTTLNIPDAVMERLREEAARRKVTMGELVEAALRRMLDETEAREPDKLELPSWNLGVPLVDISDRNALYDAMEG